MTYEQFVNEFTQYFNASIKYSPDQIGSTVFTEKMANLADDYPIFMKRLDSALEAEYCIGAMIESKINSGVRPKLD